MSEAHEQEIGCLLQISMAGLPRDSTTREELSRIWSLELQWFTPQEADLIADRLSERGWLVETADGLSAPLGLELPRPSLGWRPMARRMVDPPEFKRHTPLAKTLTLPPEPIETVVEPPAPKQQPMPRISDPEPTSMPPDRAEGSIPGLISMIGEKSGLENKEVIRRAQRKRRALGQVTLWMALALVAREQGLDMQAVNLAIEA
uniref:DUF2240 family protein n=1 Tax=uncultured marine group II/III euryarchaeote SAT1000_42_F11 TaxID=1456584 RepID=A0A075IDL1_9EURY|nr:hypothetical protein [uncultured marine group II/III euryarchaeote SAT1000_42_F11]